MSEWYAILKNDDDITLRRHLTSHDESENRRLLNNSLNDYPGANTVSDSVTSTPLRGIARPFHLAAAFGSHRVCRVMVQYGVDAYLAEADGGNVFHCLVYVTALRQTREEQAMKTFRIVQKILPNRVTFDLLKSENLIGLRPLEFAAYRGTFSLMAAMLDTPGIVFVQSRNSWDLCVSLV